MATVRGGIVLPHVQAFANDLQDHAPDVNNFGTYPGHSPSLNRALDIFHAIGDNSKADTICRFAIDNLDYYGVDYVISRKRIYNPEVLTDWRNMSDRGGATQNHYDHVHVSFEETGNASAQASGKPTDDNIPAWPGRYFRSPPGTSGEDVSRWQNRMLVRGWAIDVDGDYGPKSKQVCLSFQKEKGFSPDGIVGPETWSGAWALSIT